MKIFCYIFISFSLLVVGCATPNSTAKAKEGFLVQVGPAGTTCYKDSLPVKNCSKEAEQKKRTERDN